MEIVQGKTGNVNYDLSLTSAGLAVAASYQAGPVLADVKLVLGADELILALEKAWPNSIAVAVEEALRKYIASLAPVAAVAAPSA